MKLTSEQKNQIDSLTKTPQWALTEDILREQIADMADIRTINLQADIEKQVYGRLESIKALEKFLRRTKMLTKDPIKLNHNKYI